MHLSTRKRFSFFQVLTFILRFFVRQTNNNCAPTSDNELQLGVIDFFFFFSFFCCGFSRSLWPTNHLFRFQVFFSPRKCKSDKTSARRGIKKKNQKFITTSVKPFFFFFCYRTYLQFCRYLKNGDLLSVPSGFGQRANGSDELESVADSFRLPSRILKFSTQNRLNWKRKTFCFSFFQFLMN